jgi:translation initiation factor IF-3
VQLTASIDPHDFQTKVNHAIGFLCDEMKVKAALRFRGREMAHQEFGRDVVDRFIQKLSPYGHPDAPPKLVGRGLTLMMSPLPRNKRAKRPDDLGPAPVESEPHENEDDADSEEGEANREANGTND